MFMMQSHQELQTKSQCKLWFKFVRKIINDLNEGSINKNKTQTNETSGVPGGRSQKHIFLTLLLPYFAATFLFNIIFHIQESPDDKNPSLHLTSRIVWNVRILCLRG